MMLLVKDMFAYWTDILPLCMLESSGKNMIKSTWVLKRNIALYPFKMKCFNEKNVRV
jgi:hypothetical protein